MSTSAVKVTSVSSVWSPLLSQINVSFRFLILILLIIPSFVYVVVTLVLSEMTGYLKTSEALK